MATTASGEFHGFSYLHHHHHHHSSEQYYRHEHYHHHFHHPTFDNNYPSVGYSDRHGQVTPPPDVQSLQVFKDCNGQQGLHPGSAEKEKRGDESRGRSPNFLPPIGDALLRRDNASELKKVQAQGEDNQCSAANESCSSFVQEDKRPDIADLEDLSANSVSSASKEKGGDKSSDGPGDFSVKTESEQAEMMYPFTRNFNPFTSTNSRNSPENDIGGLMPVESSGSVEAFFRSETSLSTTTAQPVDSVATPAASGNDGPSYATLTPLQPLPPLATVADKYIPANTNNYATLMQQDKNDYSKMGGMGHSLPPLSNRMLLNGLAAQSRGGMQSQAALDAVNQAAAAAAVGLTHYNKILPSNIIQPPQSSNHYDPPMFRIDQCNDATAPIQSGPVFPPHPAAAFTHQYPSTIHDFAPNVPVNSPPDRRNLRSGSGPCSLDPPKPRSGAQDRSPASGGGSNSSRVQQMEEVNTKEVASKITQELKRYSIPQAIFAQRVLCRSQGTLSDLLRNPKPWSKLKSGRETFRRMWKWLQEPEFQRMSSLRLAGECKFQNTFYFCFVHVSVLFGEMSRAL